MIKVFALLLFFPVLLARCFIDAFTAVGFAAKIEWRALKRILRGQL